MDQMPDSASSSVLWLQVTKLLLQGLHDGLLEGLEKIDRGQTAAAAAATLAAVAAVAAAVCVCVR